MKYLCIRQPWAALIMSGIKDVENRRKPTKFRGRFVVVASKTWVFNVAYRLHHDQGFSLWDHLMKTLPYPGQLYSQPIRSFFSFRAALGTVELIDCAQNHPSRWAEPGQWHWVLRNPQPFEKPVPFVAGRLGLFDGPEPDESGLFRPHDGQTRRVDVRKEPADVMITRPGKWGNPYKIIPPTADEPMWLVRGPVPRRPERGEMTFRLPGTKHPPAGILGPFESWVENQKHLMADLPELHGKRLGCFCGADEPCHGDILVKLVKEVCG